MYRIAVKLMYFSRFSSLLPPQTFTNHKTVTATSFSARQRCIYEALLICYNLADCILSQIEDVNHSAQINAAQQLAAQQSANLSNVAPAITKPNDDDDEVPELEAAEDDGPVDETGLDPKEIELVMAQVNCSRAKAVKVLKENGGDIINASKFIR